MATLTYNKSSIGRTRRETLGNREYIVAPLSMLVPGVLNGSRGPLLYPPELVNKNPAVWNHVPIVVYHPTENGSPVSARDPSVLNKQGVGYVFKSRQNGRAEGWFDVENVKRVDPRVYEALIKNQPMELSTGLFTRNRSAQPGSAWRGKEYKEIVVDFVPDHLAILPDQRGACSLKDGCGMLINKENNASALDKANLLVNGSPNQPRDSRGRWSSGGGGGGSGGKSGGVGGGARQVASEVLGADLTSSKVTQYGDDTQIKGMGIGEVKPKMEQAGYTHTGSEKAEYGATKHTFVKGASEVSVRDEGGRVILSHKENHSQAKSGSAIDSHETVKQMQKHSETAKAHNDAANAIQGRTRFADLSAADQAKYKEHHAKRDAALKEANDLAGQMLSKKGLPKKPGDTTKLANALTKAEGVAKPKSKIEWPEEQRDSAMKAGNAGAKKRKRSGGGPIQNQEGSQFGKPHNTVKEMPNMATNQEIELTEEDRQELIDIIVDNCGECDESTDKETLNELSDLLLSQLAVNAVPPQFMKKKVVAEEEESDEEEEMEEEEEVPVKNSRASKVTTKKEKVTVNKSSEETPKLDAKTQFLVNYAQRKMQEEKDALIEKLTANVSEEDKEGMIETLNEESIEKLETLVKLLPKVDKSAQVQNSQNNRSSQRSYVGAGGAVPKNQTKQVNNSRKTQEENDPLSGPLEVPTLNYAAIAGYSNGNFIHRNNLGQMSTN